MFSRMSVLGLVLLLGLSSASSKAELTPAEVNRLLQHQPMDCDKFIATSPRMLCLLMNNMTQLQGKVDGMTKDMTFMKKDVADAKKGVAKLETDVAGVQKGVNTLEEDIHPTIRDCPLGFKHEASVNSCFRLVHEAMSWKDADEKCHAIHPKAHLVTINSEAKNKIVDDLMYKHKHKACTHTWLQKDYQAYWSAGQWIDPDVKVKSGDLSTPFVWRKSSQDYWVETISPIKYTQWGPGQPNNFGGKEGCISYWASWGGWSDEQCGGIRCAFCELDIGQ